MKLLDIAQNGQERLTLADPCSPYQKVADLTAVSPEGVPDTEKNQNIVSVEVTQDEKPAQKEVILNIINQLMKLL